MGSSWWERKTTETQALILQHAPDLAFISEANLREDIPDDQTHIGGYYIIKPNTSLGMGYSRKFLLVREGFVFLV